MTSVSTAVVAILGAINEQIGCTRFADLAAA